MATRSNIRVILKEEDRNRDMKFSPNEKQKKSLAEKPWGHETKEGCWETVNPEGKPALIIYHHWDGYPEGVGAALLSKYNDYDKALNLVLGGDVSSITDEYEPYATRKGEEWEYVKPSAVEEDFPLQEEYDYMFKDGEWFVRGLRDMDENEWVVLSDVLNKTKQNEDVR